MPPNGGEHFLCQPPNPILQCSLKISFSEISEDRYLKSNNLANTGYRLQLTNELSININSKKRACPTIQENNPNYNII